MTSSSPEQLSATGAERAADAGAIADAKAALRAGMLARRAALAPQVRVHAATALAGHAARLEPVAGEVIAGFSPIRGEIDPLPLLAVLDEAGATIALPAVTADGLVFRRWRPGEPLVSAGFGTREPAADAETVRPSLLLVPLLAFDRTGGRLGYGKSFYDRAITALLADGPLRTAGIAFSAQETATVPMENHDRRLDLVLTECEAIDCRGNRAGAARD
ncbi:MAG: 5-formyltetrahydrofolate cyclo-ligase [Hyphomicrobiales bacterium]